MKYDPHKSGAQYLEDLATSYWYASALFTALDSGLFDVLRENNELSAEDAAAKLGWQAGPTARFLNLLKEMGLVDVYADQWYNTGLTTDHLVDGAPQDQRANIRWRRDLRAEWDTLPDVLAAGTRTLFPPDDVSEADMHARRVEYLKAMDAVIDGKIAEMLPMFTRALPENAAVLDVGCGSGKFAMSVLDACPGATAEAESASVLEEAAAHLAPDGILLVHDFFLEHVPVKSRLSDINMMVNTYNGRAYSAKWTADTLKAAGCGASAFVPLSTDTGVLFACQKADRLKDLALDPAAQLIPKIKALGFADAIPFKADDVVFSPFARNKCQYGCQSAYEKTCISNRNMSYDETQAMVGDYRRGLLLCSEPPTGDFQRRCLAAEAEAFKSGFYKAFVFWAGPCSICKTCDPKTPCANPAHHRPSMEGCGIDVYATVNQVGETLHPLRRRGETVKYYGLLLLD